MGLKRIVNLPSVSGWIGTAGASFAAHTITVDIPVGPRYHVIWCNVNPGASKVATALFGEMRLKINGKVQRVMTADELNKLNLLNGLEYACKNLGTNAAEVSLPIFLAEPWRKSPAEADGMAWATGDVDTFQLEIDITAYGAAAAGLTVPSFKAEIDNSLVEQGGRMVDQPLGVITKWLNFQLPIAQASSWHDFTGLPKRDFYQSLHLTELNIDEFEIKVDNSIIRQATQTQNAQHLQARGMVPNPTATATPFNLAADIPTRGYIDIVFDHDDRINSALPMNFGNGRKVQDFNLRLKSGASGTVPRNVKAIVQLAGAAE